MNMISQLHKTLDSGSFAVTAELTLPDSSEKDGLVETALKLSPYCDALNVTDATSAIPHFSSLAAASILLDNDIEPVMQISARDRNRIAIQGDVLGAHSLGIRNIFCITGDAIIAGDHPDAKPVFDLDSISMLAAINKMAKTGSFMSGRKITPKPTLFLGAAANPFAPPHDYRPHRTIKKWKAGASFFQTQFCFDIKAMERFSEKLVELSGGKPPPVLVGLGPLKSSRMAKWLRDNIAGVSVPDRIIERMDKYPRKEQAQIGLEISKETINDLKSIQGVAGIHIMAFKWEEAVKEIVEDSGLAKHKRLP